jgi:hypothetical protein
VTDQEHGRARGLGQLEKAQRALTQLGDAARQRFDVLGHDRLDRIDDRHAGLRPTNGFDDGVGVRLAQEQQIPRAELHASSAQANLGNGFLTRDVQDLAPGVFGDRIGHLRQQGGLADAGITADERQRAFDDATAEDARHFLEADGDAVEVGRLDLVQTQRARRRGDPGTTIGDRRSLRRFLEGAPGVALGASA